MTRITVLLADDHTLIREGLRAILELVGDFEVVGEADNGLQAVELAQELHPEVVVMDIAMPQLNGIEAARRILQQVAPPPKILMLSGYVNDAHIDQAIALGVAGYLVKETSGLALAKTIREIHDGKVIYSPVIAKRVDDQQRQSSAPKGRVKAGPVHLTPREREVLQMVAEGNLNKEVAAGLKISTKTVEKHRHNIMEKLGIRDTAGLTRYAMSAGVVKMDFRRPQP